MNFWENRHQPIKNESIQIEAKYFKEELILSDLLDERSDYYDVINDTGFMKYLTVHLAVELSHNVSTSIYGKNLFFCSEKKHWVGISDFHLYFHCNTEKSARLYFAQKFPSVFVPDAVYYKIMKKIRAIRQRLYRLRNNIIANMELLNTPDFEYRKNLKKKEKKEMKEMKEKKEKKKKINKYL
jgi:hypothetical protein